MVEQTSPCNAHLSSHALPSPPPPSAPVTSVRNHMIYHTNTPPQHHPDCFDFSIDISDHPTCMHFSWLASNGKRVPTNDGHEKHPEKIRCYISHSVPGALCATIMFTLCSMSSEAGQHICLCMSSCLPEDIAFRKKPIRDIPLPLRGQRHGGHWCAGGL